VNELTQSRASQRLTTKKRVAHEVAKIIEERNKLVTELASIPFIQKVYQSDANFVLVKVDDADKRYHELIQKGIVIRNRSTQPLCENTLRFTVGTVDENKQLIQVLNEIN
jgi:histidinol-phosphate aminotransferase